MAIHAVRHLWELLIDEKATPVVDVHYKRIAPLLKEPLRLALCINTWSGYRHDVQFAKVCLSLWRKDTCGIAPLCGIRSDRFVKSHSFEATWQDFDSFHRDVKNRVVLIPSEVRRTDPHWLKVPSEGWIYANDDVEAVGAEVEKQTVYCVVDGLLVITICLGFSQNDGLKWGNQMLSLHRHTVLRASKQRYKDAILHKGECAIRWTVNGMTKDEWEKIATRLPWKPGKKLTDQECATAFNTGLSTLKSWKRKARKMARDIDALDALLNALRLKRLSNINKE